MKILFSLTYYQPYISGLTLYCQRLAEELVKGNHKVSVLTSQFDQTLSKKDAINGVAVNRVPYLLSLSKGLIMPLWPPAALREIKKHDVLIINLPQAEGFLAALIGRLLGKRVISIYHCEVVLPAGLVNRFIQRVLTLGNVLTIALSETVITYTPDFAQHSKILSLFKAKLKTIYPPITMPIIKLKKQQELREIIKSRSSDYIIGVASRISSEKGIEYLIESLPLADLLLKTKGINKTIKIVIAGPTQVFGEKSYQKKIAKLVENQSGRIIFLGSLLPEEMGSFYSLLDLLVLPSVNSTESFGIVQVEAMLCGIPVVASNLPGVRVPIQKTGMGLLVPPKDSQKLAQAIIKVLTNKEKFVGDKAFIEKEFSLDKTIFFYEDLFWRNSQ